MLYQLVRRLKRSLCRQIPDFRHQFHFKTKRCFNLITVKLKHLRNDKIISPQSVQGLLLLELLYGNLRKYCLISLFEHTNPDLIS